MTYSAYSSSSALLFAFFTGQSLGSRRCHPLRRTKRTLSPEATLIFSSAQCSHTPLTALTALTAHIFRTTESPIAGPARFPDLVRLVRTFLHRDQHGERTVVAGSHHLNQAVTYSAYSAFSALFSGPKSRKPSIPPIKALKVHKAHTFPPTHGNRGRVEMFQPLSATMNLAGAWESDHLCRRQDAQINN